MTAVSVALATYNGERFLLEQLASLARQTRLPAEVVACDDGSTDGTVELLRRFGEEAPFPVRIHQNATRLGFADNFLKAASLCRSELIAFCDQDDVWLEHKLERCAAALGARRSGLVAHRAEVVDAALRPSGRQLPPRRQLRDLRQLTPWPDWPGFAMVFSAELLSVADPARRPRCPIVPDDEVMCHDTWAVFVANALGGVVALDEPLVLYRQHGENTAGAPPKQRLGPTLAASMVVGSHRYRWLAERATEWASYFSRCSPVSSEDASALARASALYTRVAEVQTARAAIHDPDRLRRQRLRQLLQVAAGGGYFSRARSGLGGRSLVKDVLVSLGPLAPAGRERPASR